MHYKLYIKKYRIKRGMTQEELAEKSKIKQSYISQLENSPNTKSPTLRTIFRIANALGICPHLLIQYNTDCEFNCTLRCKRKFF